MSYISLANGATAPPRVQANFCLEPIEVISAVSLAHRHRIEPWERGRMAAAWADGRALVIPTVELASTVFDVSYPLIAKERCPASLPLKLLTYGWQAAAPYERDLFVRANLVPVWTAIERVTA
jgi:hypothetical protein